MTKTIHQLGHNSTWNIQAHDEDGVGDGFIISPMHLGKSKLADWPVERRRRSFFDPQFVIPGDAKKNLASYEFHPGAGGDDFATQSYPQSAALPNASSCVAFQVQNDFRALVIPSRHLDVPIEDYIRQQHSLFVTPFLTAIKKSKSKKQIFLQVFLTNRMVEEVAYRDSLITWLSSLEEIDGVYLVPSYKERSGKHITSPAYIVGVMELLYKLKQNQILTVVGYTNVEGVLYSCAGADWVGMGSYENTRIFNIANFADAEGGPQQGPRPRIYAPILFQWIDYRYREPIVNANKGWVFADNRYKVLLWQLPTGKWNFQRSELYKHYFVEYTRQLQRLGGVDESTRVKSLYSELDNARSEFDRLESAGVILDSNSGGGHIPFWMTALAEFARARGWSWR